VGTILKHFKDLKNFRIIVLPDHATPISIRTHSNEPVPFAIFGKGITPDQFDCFNEKVSCESSLVVNAGWELMNLLVKKG